MAILKTLLTDLILICSTKRDLPNDSTVIQVKAVIPDNRLGRVLTDGLEDAIFNLIPDSLILNHRLKTFDEIFVVHRLVEGGENHTFLMNQSAKRLHHLMTIREVDRFFAQTCYDFRDSVCLAGSRSSLENDTFLVFERSRYLVVISLLHIVVVYVIIFSKCVCRSREIEEILFLNLARFHLSLNLIHQLFVIG